MGEHTALQTKDGNEALAADCVTKHSRDSLLSHLTNSELEKTKIPHQYPQRESLTDTQWWPPVLSISPCLPDQGEVILSSRSGSVVKQNYPGWSSALVFLCRRGSQVTAHGQLWLAPRPDIDRHPPSPFSHPSAPLI
ncbi:hypothetical protein ACOMHN_044304 [Nucella lapillus]